MQLSSHQNPSPSSLESAAREDTRSSDLVSRKAACESAILAEVPFQEDFYLAELGQIFGSTLSFEISHITLSPLAIPAWVIFLKVPVSQLVVTFRRGLMKGRMATS